MPLLAAIALALAPDVITVDPDPAAGADTTSLDVALALAQDGDTTVVAEGIYTASGAGTNPLFRILAKGIELIGRPGPRPRLFSGLMIEDLSADQRVTARGLILRPGGGCDTLAVSLPATIFPVGTTAADGALGFAPLLPTLPPGTEARSFDAQALWSLTDGTAALGQPRHLTVVDLDP